MDEHARIANLIAFYFGPNVAQEVPPKSKKAIEAVSHRAYRDLCRTLTHIGTHPKKNKLLDETHSSLYGVVTQLETDPVRDQQDFDDRHERWCLDRISFFKEHPHGDKNKKVDFTYGHAQKWINMTLKYLAVLQHPAVLEVYSYLHVPVDSIVYEEAEDPTLGIAVPRPPGGKKWSKLSGEQYRTYQEQLRGAIADQGECVAPLDWEAKAWVNRASRQ